MAHDQPFWTDAEYDADHADCAGGSRYAAYVRDGNFEPWTDRDRHIELAAFAWRRATTPVMSPGYVRRHPRIATVQIERSDWDGSLVAMVDLLVPRPESLRHLSADGGRPWRDWPSEYSFGAGRTLWYEPSGEDLASGPYLLCTASLRFTVPSGDLPQPPDTDLPNVRVRDAPALAEACKQSVEVLVRKLNAIVGPVIDCIEGS